MAELDELLEILQQNPDQSDLTAQMGLDLIKSTGQKRGLGQLAQPIIAAMLRDTIMGSGKRSRARQSLQDILLAEKVKGARSAAAFTPDKYKELLGGGSEPAPGETITRGISGKPGSVPTFSSRRSKKGKEPPYTEQELLLFGLTPEVAKARAKLPTREAQEFSLNRDDKIDRSELANMRAQISLTRLELARDAAARAKDAATAANITRVHTQLQHLYQREQLIARILEAGGRQLGNQLSSDTAALLESYNKAREQTLKDAKDLGVPIDVPPRRFSMRKDKMFPLLPDAVNPDVMVLEDDVFEPSKPLSGAQEPKKGVAGKPNTAPKAPSQQQAERAGEAAVRDLMRKGEPVTPEGIAERTNKILRGLGLTPVEVGE